METVPDLTDPSAVKTVSDEKTMNSSVFIGRPPLVWPNDSGRLTGGAVEPRRFNVGEIVQMDRDAFFLSLPEKAQAYSTASNWDVCFAKTMASFVTRSISRNIVSRSMGFDT
jgi:hypothetical protein